MTIDPVTRIDLDQLIDSVEARTPHGTALERVAEASVMVGELGELADHLLGHFVDSARAEGASWSQIGGNLGVSKQAVQKRFVSSGDPDVSAFTNRAAIVLLKAQNAARDGAAPQTTTQHLALGLIEEWRGIAGQALESVGVSAEALRTAIEATLPEPGEVTAEHRMISLGLRRALELARRRGLRMGHSYVGTEHLLLGLLDAQEAPSYATRTALVDAPDPAEAIEAAIGDALHQWHAARA